MIYLIILNQHRQFSLCHCICVLPHRFSNFIWPRISTVNLRKLDNLLKHTQSIEGEFWLYSENHPQRISEKTTGLYFLAMKLPEILYHVLHQGVWWMYGEIEKGICICISTHMHISRQALGYYVCYTQPQPLMLVSTRSNTWTNTSSAHKVHTNRIINLWNFGRHQWPHCYQRLHHPPPCFIPLIGI